LLTSLIKHRPKHLLAVYIEPWGLEILRAHRQWRSWQIDAVEQFAVQEGESVYDSLQRLNLRPRNRQATALVLFLPRLYYTFHCEYYPSTLGEHLEEALAFDWQENVFNDNGQMLYFSGPPVPINGHLSVPIFTLQKDLYDKFYQILGGASFKDFIAIPSALAYRSFLSTLPKDSGNASALEIFGRIVDPSHLEIHRYYRGHLLDSTIVNRRHDQLRLFREAMSCIGTEEDRDLLRIHLLCRSDESRRNPAGKWKDSELPVEVRTLDEPLISHWVKYLFGQESVENFGTPLYLKPWEIPKIAWLVLAVMALYSVFGFFQSYSHDRLLNTSRNLMRERAQLEVQWKPVEQLQTRIAKFQEDQKTLSQFNREGYPIVEILTMLSMITPEDTWLNYLSLRNGQFMLRGESDSAIKYLSELSKVEGFEDVRFASPVTRNPASNKERFNVQVQISLDKLEKTLEAVPVEKAELSVESEDANELLTPSDNQSDSESEEQPTIPSLDQETEQETAE